MLPLRTLLNLTVHPCLGGEFKLSVQNCVRKETPSAGGAGLMAGVRSLPVYRNASLGEHGSSRPLL